jgi:hypothetical protein
MRGKSVCSNGLLLSLFAELKEIAIFLLNKGDHDVHIHICPSAERTGK